MKVTRENFIHNKDSLDSINSLLKKYSYLGKSQIMRAGLILLNQQKEIDKEILSKAS